MTTRSETCRAADISIRAIRYALTTVKQVKGQQGLLKPDLFDESVVVDFDVNIDRCGGEILEDFSQQRDALVIAALTVALYSDKG